MVTAVVGPTPRARYRTAWVVGWFGLLTVAGVVSGGELPPGTVVGILITVVFVCLMGACSRYHPELSGLADPRWRPVVTATVLGSWLITAASCLLAFSLSVFALYVVLALLSGLPLLPGLLGRVRAGHAARSGSPAGLLVGAAPAAVTPGLSPGLLGRLVDGLDDHALASAWRSSYFSLLDAPSAEARSAVAAVRQAYLEEIERRHPDETTAWIERGGPAPGVPDHPDPS